MSQSGYNRRFSLVLCALAAAASFPRSRRMLSSESHQVMAHLRQNHGLASIVTCTECTDSSLTQRSYINQHHAEPAVHAGEGTGCGCVPLVPAATARGGWLQPTGQSIEVTVVPKATCSDLQNKTEGHSSNGRGAWTP